MRSATKVKFELGAKDIEAELSPSAGELEA